MKILNYINVINQEHSLVYNHINIDNLYTYSIMGVSGVGFLLAKRGGYSTLAMGLAFVSAPLFALFQKR